MRFRAAHVLAPAALIAAVIAVAVIARSSTSDDTASDQAARTTATSDAGSGSGRTTTTRREGGGSSSRPRTYTVKAGDSFGSISEATGVSVERLTELNPDADANALTVGETLRLRGEAGG